MGHDHEHLSPRDWVLVFENADDDARSLLRSCADARALWTEGMAPWLEHVAGCAACRAVAEAENLLAVDSLDCPECRSNLELVHQIVEEAEHFEPVVALELQRAERLLEELAPRPFAAAVREIRTEGVYQQWGLGQRLLAASRAAWRSDPELALHRALLAVVVAQELDPDSYTEAWIADLEAKAHAYVANAHRILGRFAEAEAEFELAEACLRRGVRSGQAEARVHSLKVSLLNDQSRHGEALALLAQIERFYQGHDERHEVGRLVLHRAHVLYSAGEPARAAEECLRATTKLAPSLDRDLLLVAQKNAVGYLVSAGELDRARALFDELPPMPEPLEELRRLWAEADLLRAEGRHAESCAVYERVRAGFAAAGLHYDAALAALDLARTAYAQGGPVGEVRALAEQAAVQLTLAGAKAEAFAAHRLVLQAIRDDVLSHALLVRVRQHLETLRPS